MGKTMKVTMSPEPVLVYSMSSLAAVSVSDIIEQIEGHRRAAKAAVQYRYDNSHYRLSDICGIEHAFHLDENKDNTYTLRLWDYRGGTSEGQFTFKPEQGMIPRDVLRKIEQLMTKLRETSTDGFVCCECERVLPQARAKGSCYAATICDKCWTPQWAADSAATMKDNS